MEIPEAFPKAKMKPIPEKASDGRANPKGIVCLYLANLKETAILEVRPLIGSYVSVAKFKAIRGITFSKLLIQGNWQFGGNKRKTISRRNRKISLVRY